MEAAPATAADIQEEAKEDEVEVHDPIAGEVVRVVSRKAATSPMTIPLAHNSLIGNGVTCTHTS